MFQIKSKLKLLTEIVVKSRCHYGLRAKPVSCRSRPSVSLPVEAAREKTYQSEGSSNGGPLLAGSNAGDAGHLDRVGVLFFQRGRQSCIAASCRRCLIQSKKGRSRPTRPRPVVPLTGGGAVSEGVYEFRSCRTGQLLNRRSIALILPVGFPRWELRTGRRLVETSYERADN